jgi:hypothetical protein
VAKPNYRFVKQQKEAARKARKLQKLERKQSRGTEEPAADGQDPAAVPATPERAP